MTVENILKEVEDLVVSFEKQRKELEDKLKPAFGEIFKPFFTKYPEVANIKFVAYTPYFNDGDTCEYSVNDLYYFVKDDNEDDEYWEGYGDSYQLKYHKELITYLRGGPIGPEIQKWFTQNTKTPLRRFNFKTREYDVTENPRFNQTIEEYIKEKFKEELHMGADALEKKINRDADFQEVRNLFSRIPEDIIHSLFGDHIMVTIHSNGEVEKDEYEHD